MYLTLVLLYAEQLTNGNQWKVVDVVREMILTGPVFLFKINVEIGPSLRCCGQSCSQSRTIVKLSVWKLAE